MADDRKFVSWLQARLNDLGYQIEVDGVNGPQTQNAIRDVQRAFGLKETGTATQEFMDRFKTIQAEGPAQLTGSVGSPSGPAPNVAGRMQMTPPMPNLRPRSAVPQPLGPGQRISNGDGSYSTERLRTVQMADGQWANVPSLIMGPQGPVDVGFMPDDALSQVASRMETGGKQFPRFPDIATAEAAARTRSNMGGAGSGPLLSQSAPRPSPSPDQLIGPTGRSGLDMPPSGGLTPEMMMPQSASGPMPAPTDREMMARALMQQGTPPPPAAPGPGAGAMPPMGPPPGVPLTGPGGSPAPQFPPPPSNPFGEMLDAGLGNMMIPGYAQKRQQPLPDYSTANSPLAGVESYQPGMEQQRPQMPPPMQAGMVPPEILEMVKRQLMQQLLQMQGR